VIIGVYLLIGYFVLLASAITLAAQVISFKVEKKVYTSLGIPNPSTTPHPTHTHTQHAHTTEHYTMDMPQEQ
jgi:hypothetical protein